jgi:hypothetical protein
MNIWKVQQTPNGLRLLEGSRRQLGSDHFTWAHLLYGQLGQIHVYALYFPSLVPLPADQTVIAALHDFGTRTGKDTSVNLWDTTDPQFSKALEFFDLKAPPALVFVSGLEVDGIEPYGPDKANLYSIVLTRSEVLSSRELLASAINRIHTILVRSDPKEISAYLRQQKLSSLLSAIAKVANVVANEIIKLRPKFQLPDGSSIQLGG